MTDEDRVIKEAVDEFERLRAEYQTTEAAWALPQPGERHNASGIPVSDVALAALLSLAQQGMVLAECQVEDCEDCNALRLIWWDCCNALDKSTRIALQSWLISEGWGLPASPWEEVEPDGTPYPRDYAGPHA